MKEYHKIQTVFLRDPETKYKTLLEGQYALPEFEYLKDCDWVFTEKVDGTNIRVMFDGENLTFGGKTDRANIPSPLVNRLNERFLPQKPFFRGHFPDGVCLYGEGYGAKIQKGGGNYGPDQDFVLFDIKVGEWWLKREDVDLIANVFGLDVVPSLGIGPLSDMIQRCKWGFLSLWGDFQAEGIVARPRIELKARNGSRIITKLKCKDFVKGEITCESHLVGGTG